MDLITRESAPRQSAETLNKNETRSDAISADMNRQSSKNTKSNSNHVDNTTENDKEMDDRVVGGSRSTSIRPSESESNDGDQDEEDVQKLLTDINSEAIVELKNEETDTALEALRRGEQMLEYITAEGREVDRNLIIVILYN